MNVSCNDRERIFLDGSAEEWTALEQHATTCAPCAEEIRAWKSLSAAAEELRDYREHPQLWTKIEKSLKEQSERRNAWSSFWERLGLWRDISVGWRAGLVGAFALVLALSGAYVIRHRGGDSSQGRLLRNSALAEVERTERDYMKAIDQLAAEAKPQLDSPVTPLMASYREKLVVLDSAIGELRLEAGRNPSNAHLRYELLAMYQEKQQTLQDVLETKR